MGRDKSSRRGRDDCDCDTTKDHHRQRDRACDGNTCIITKAVTETRSAVILIITITDPITGRPGVKIQKALVSVRASERDRMIGGKTEKEAKTGLEMGSRSGRDPMNQGARGKGVEMGILSGRDLMNRCAREKRVEIEIRSGRGLVKERGVEIGTRSERDPGERGE